MPVDTAVMRGFFALSAIGAGKDGITLLASAGASKVEDKAVQETWGGKLPPLAANVLGSMFLATSLLSAVGAVTAPAALSPLLVFQCAWKAVLFFKSTLPALRRRRPEDKPALIMGLVFLPYVFVLPFALPWKDLAEALRG